MRLKWVLKWHIGTHTATYAHIWVPIYAHIRQTPIRSYSHTKVDDPGGGADDNVPGGGSWVHQHQPSILLSMNWTTPAVGLMMTTPVVGPSLLRMLIPP
jgi:hypothetical protein